jgi:TolB-like protein/tetratricopeptide (TPR) repeat protein
MSQPASSAVFISYASQDVEAALRIAKGLRDAGIEVWFDRSELRGGDAWDQNIRRMIRECTLLVPVISRNTEERAEGYFRLEWRLADQRTHLMSRSKAFLVPVCIDESIAEHHADVPDSFLDVQWTKLPNGVPTQQFVNRVKVLLAGDADADIARTRPPFPVPQPKALPAPAVPAPTSLKPAFIATLFLVLFAIAGVAIWPRISAMLEPPASEPAPAAIAELSIAILPFDTIDVTAGADPNTVRGLASLVQDEINLALGSNRSLTTIPRTSLNQYRDTTKSIEEISSEVGVNYLVEGTILRDGESIRISGNLINAQDPTAPRRSLVQTGSLTDLFSEQSPIAGQIANALGVELAGGPGGGGPRGGRGPGGRAGRGADQAFDAYNAFRQIEETLWRDATTPAGLRNMERGLERIVEQDPDLDGAWALLGVVRSLQISNNYVTGPAQVERAREAVEQAVALEPGSPDVIRAQGVFSLRALRDFPAALAHFSRLREVQPNNSNALGLTAAVLRRQGQRDEALRELDIALRTDALNLTHLRTVEQTLLDTRHFQQAADIRNRINMILQNRPEEQFRDAVIDFQDTGQTTRGEAFFTQMSPDQLNSRLVVSLRTEWARMTGNLDETLRLQAEPQYDDGSPSWFRTIDNALALRVAGNVDGASTLLGAIPAQIRQRLTQEPDNADLWAWLGLAEALLGNRAQALQAAQTAADLFPLEVDAVEHPIYQARLALVQAWVGDTDTAIDTIGRLLRTAGFTETVHTLRTDLRWSPLQANERFIALLNDPANDAQLGSEQTNGLAGRIGRGGRGGRGGGGRGGDPQFIGGQNPDGQQRGGRFPGGRAPRGGNGAQPQQQPGTTPEGGGALPE